MLKAIWAALKKSLKMKIYPTADKNAGSARLLFQGLPYYLSKDGYSFPPLSVFIHVNTLCNLKCKMCDAGQDVPESMFYRNLKGGENQNMPIDSFKAIIDKIKHFKPFVGIPAIEPLLYPHIREAVRYIRMQGLRSSVATNGTLLEDNAEDLVKAGLTKIVISLDGPEIIHDRIRGVEGTYKKVINGIKKLAEIKRSRCAKEPYIFLNYVISEDNYMTLAECADGLPLESIEQMDFRVMFFCTKELAQKHNRIFGGKYDATSVCLYGGINLERIEIDVLYDQISKVTRGYEGKCKFFFNHGKDGLRRYYHEPEVFLDGTRCVFPWYTMQINTDGSVIAPQRCYHNVFGNIFKQGFGEIWNGEKMRDFRRDLRRYGRLPACARCEGVNF